MRINWDNGHSDQKKANHWKPGIMGNTSPNYSTILEALLGTFFWIPYK